MINMALTFLVAVAVMLSGATHIKSEYTGDKFRVYIFKPLTMILILLLSLYYAKYSCESGIYVVCTLIGLCFSLLGDIFLIRKVEGFVRGLISFLIAHCFYIVALTLDLFDRKNRLETENSLAVIRVLIAAFGICVFFVLQKNLGKLRIPVFVYICALLAMLHQAYRRWIIEDDASTFRAFVGALLFVISDTSLALNAFRFPFKAATAVTMISYYSAQWLIASSLDC